MDQFEKIHLLAKSSIPEFETNLGGNISNSVRFEVYMFGMTIGFLHGLSKGYIEKTNESVNLLITEILIHSGSMVSIPIEEIIPLIRSRTTGLTKDLIGISKSDYPRTKQYIPYYTFNCIVYQPLIIDQDLTWANFGVSGDFDKIEYASDFLTPYGMHVNMINRSLDN